MQFAKDLDAEITYTIICGDNYMGTYTEAAVSEILGMLEGKEMDIFLAGPAFQAGRYGVACGTICKAVKEKFGVPVVTSMWKCLKSRCISWKAATALPRCVKM